MVQLHIAGGGTAKHTSLVALQLWNLQLVQSFPVFHHIEHNGCAGRGALRLRPGLHLPVLARIIPAFMFVPFLLPPVPISVPLPVPIIPPVSVVTTAALAAVVAFIPVFPPLTTGFRLHTHLLTRHVLGKPTSNIVSRDPQRRRQSRQAVHETLIGLNYAAALHGVLHGLLNPPVVLPHEVGGTKGGRTADSGPTVHKHSMTSPPCLLDEVERFRKVLTDVVALYISCLNLKVIDAGCRLEVVWVVVDSDHAAQLEVSVLLVVSGMVPVPKVQQAGYQLSWVGPPVCIGLE
mmetsp:Transcript_40121/g.113636  ORF Transcript_40121/g.113636 Transcript_40121/m.113636 type:complete len:291 (-) Transcript_40121:613-1485(-)